MNYCTLNSYGSQTPLAIRSCQLTNESDSAFVGMLEAYRNTGGLARAQEVFNLFKSHNDLGVTTLARWISLRRVLSLEWNADVWLPLFQFERQCMTIKPTFVPVLAELNQAFTPWELAYWCAQPHRWLDGDSPANMLDADAPRVLRAACSDHFALQ
jgi:hypothetical protein